MFGKRLLPDGAVLAYQLCRILKQNGQQTESAARKPNMSRLWYGAGITWNCLNGDSCDVHDCCQQGQISEYAFYLCIQKYTLPVELNYNYRTFALKLTDSINNDCDTAS
jgi:hypothetical protein